MDITLEQAKAFEAVARLGTIQKAALELNRGHSSVIYSLKCLEEQTRLKLFDRAGHRNRITLQGEIALRFCQKLLATHQEFADSCSLMKDGWEPSLKLIYDDVVDFNFIGDALAQLNKLKAPTEIKILAAHLSQVEQLFTREKADIMLTVLPLQRLQIPSQKLAPIVMHLVAHRQHPLAQVPTHRLSTDELNQHPFILISTTSGSIGLATEQMKFDSYIFVNSFVSKKNALLNGLGFGWLPDYLIRNDLKKGILKRLNTDIESQHTLYPHLYHRPMESLGKASRELVDRMLVKSI